MVPKHMQRLPRVGILFMEQAGASQRQLADTITQERTVFDSEYEIFYERPTTVAPP